MLEGLNPGQRSRMRGAWPMAFIGFLANNVSMGLTWGTFGPVVPMLEREFGTSRAAAASALGLIYLSLGLASPLAGFLVQRMPIRRVMLIGAAMNVTGNAALAFVDQFSLVLCSYALLIGPGICLMSAVPVTALLSRWFAHDRGKALGVANMLPLLLVSPPLAAELISTGGRRLLAISLAGCFLLLMPVLARIDDGASNADSNIEGKSGRATALPIRMFLSDRRFWSISLGIGFMSGAASTFAIHAVSIATSKGIDIVAASTLMSAFGTGSLLGGPIFGWLSDRIGPLPTLMVNGALLVAAWLTMIPATALSILMMLSLGMGICLGALVALHGLVLGHFYRSEHVGSAMGYSYFLKIPFLFGSAPFIGHVYDRTQSYDLGLGIVSLALAFSTLVFTGLTVAARHNGAVQPTTNH